MGARQGGESMKDKINDEMVIHHPPHYNHGKFEVYDVIKDWGLNYNIGNVLKYIGRHRHKGKALEDLKKAKWYLEQEIKALEVEEEKRLDEVIESLDYDLYRRKMTEKMTEDDEPMGCEGTE